MSEHNVASTSESSTRRRRDAGFTLPELLCTIIVLGSIVAVLSSAIIVTFRQQDNTEGRLNVTRAEQNVDLWIPADLASSGSVPSKEPNLSPCSDTLADTSTCPSNVTLTGSNALFLSWTDVDSVIGLGLVTTTTRVSYHFTPRADGTFDLMRIACRSKDSGPSTPSGPWTCEVFSVLTNLPGPPSGGFTPGVTFPWWVLQISVPPPPEAVDPDAPPDTGPTTKNASRVIVTINGGGDAIGGGGGVNQVSLTAGGTTRDTLAVDSGRNAPTFTQTQSRCGGPLTLIVDDSGSIGAGPMGSVKTAVKSFITSLIGTPVQIQIVRFDNSASVLGTTGWSKYHDMTIQTDIDALNAAVDTLVSDGGTNWEDAWFRTFYSQDGSPAPITPKTVVFFTDGVPTWERLDPAHRGGGGAFDPLKPPAPLPGYFPSTGLATDYSQVGFDRTDYYASERRAAADVRLIGVGVGPYIGKLTGTIPATPDTTSPWMPAPRVVYNKTGEERSTFTYQQSGFTYSGRYQASSTWAWQGQYQAQSTWTYQKAQSWNYQRFVSGSWTSTTSTLYNTNNYTIDETDGWRRLQSGTTWTSSNATEYNANNYKIDETDGWRRIGSGAFTNITKAVYDANNYKADNTDGYQDLWSTITSTLYNSNNLTIDETDGYRKVGSGAWTNITKAVYDANNYKADNTDGYQDLWSTITTTEYNASNTTNDDTDGYRRVSNGVFSGSITKPVYDANNTTADSSDGFRRTNPSGSWLPITEAEYNARNLTGDETDGVRPGPDVPSPTGAYMGPAVTYSTRNAEILARLITGSFTGPMVVPWSGALNSNERLANMFVEPNWSLVPPALKAVALGECGGTLTIQTKTASGYADDDFDYQNTGLTDPSGNALQANGNFVTTSLSTKAATFDFDITDGTYRTVEIEPLNASELTAAGYTGGSWSCKSGGVATPNMTTYDIVDNDWTGLRVRVGANEAVSCIHLVT